MSNLKRITGVTLTTGLAASLLSIGHGQMEAALSVVLTPWLVIRRIIIPQSLTSALPNICNTTVNVLKSTSLAYMMTVQDIMPVAKKHAAFGYNYIEAYLVKAGKKDVYRIRKKTADQL